jgi:hypothetical protein
MADAQEITGLDDERKYIEELLNDRFNFFMLFFSIIAAGAAATTSQVLFRWILTIGSLVSWFLAMTIYRCFYKQRLLWHLLEETNKNHAAIWAHAQAKGRRMSLFSVIWILGWFIPMVCTISISIAAMLAWFGCLSVTDTL